MSDTTWMFMIFVSFHIASAIAWRAERQKLINKLMSRNFHDYQFSNNIEKTLRPDGDLREGIKAEEALAEDLSPIRGFGIN